MDSSQIFFCCCCCFHEWTEIILSIKFDDNWWLYSFDCQFWIFDWKFKFNSTQSLFESKREKTFVDAETTTTMTMMAVICKYKMCKYVADDYNYKVVYDDDNDDNGIWKYLIKK